MAVARHLYRWGLLAGIACTDLEALSGPAADEAKALLALDVRPDPEPQIGDADVVLDALLGTGLSGPPTGRVREWIEAINSSHRQVVAVDLPSGLDADTGAIPGACVRANTTVTLCLPKPGLLTERGLQAAGEVWVVDIGIPNEIYVGAGIDPPGPMFAHKDQLRLADLRDLLLSR
jgi:NAD(P)H-hydrate epimerase